MTSPHLSRIGAKMAGLSGLRGIMEDIATSTAARSDTRWLNLGIGNPANVSQVTDAWRQMTADTVANRFAQVSCSYGGSRGLPDLIHAIVRYFGHKYGWSIGPENVVVGPGSQMLCFIAAALFTGPGDARDARLVLPMTPDYTGYQGLAMAAGSVVGVEPIVVLTGERSFRYLLDLRAVQQQSDVGLLLMSSPSNPAGRYFSADELQDLIGAAEGHRAPLMIDNAYGTPFPAIGDFLAPPVQHDRVINSFSVSKAGLPGERLGFAIGDAEYIRPIVSFLANCTLHAPQLVQATVAHALDSNALDSLVDTAIRPFYAERRKLVESLLVEHLPAEVAWRAHDSDGGMFFWIWVDEDWFDDLRLYQSLREQAVFVVPGRHFFTGPASGGRLGRHAHQCFRISITPDPETLADGIARIGAALGNRQFAAV